MDGRWQRQKGTRDSFGGGAFRPGSLLDPQLCLCSGPGRALGHTAGLEGLQHECHPANFLDCWETRSRLLAAPVKLTAGQKVRQMVSSGSGQYTLS